MHKKLLVLLLLVSSASVGVTMPRATWRQIVPAVASTHGLDGSFWRSDVTLYNSSSTAATVTVELVPRQGQAAPPPVTLASTLGPARSLTLADVVGAYFPGNTAGALVVTAKDADGQDVALAVTSRTWTPSADGSGSLGQAIPAMAWAKDGDLEDPERAVFPLASSATVRSNLGIVNPTDAVTESFVVDLRDGAGVLLASFPLELPPRTQRQLDDLPRLHAAEGDGLSATVRLVDWQDGSAGAERPDFAVYGSRIDRQSNDATYLEPQPAVTRTGAARARLVPVAASSAGSAGSHWRTDLAVHYPGDAAGVLIVIQLIPSGTGGAAGQPPFIIRTGVARGTLVIEDVLGTGFPGYSAAALEVRGIVQNTHPYPQVGSACSTASACTLRSPCRRAE